MSLSPNTVQDTLNGYPSDFDVDQLLQHMSTSEQVSGSFALANAAFAAQLASPDAKTYTDTCDQLARFLCSGFSMTDDEQQSLVMVLQAACAVHENARNNRRLTAAERSEHAHASKAFVDLCSTALSNLRQNEHWFEVFFLICQADKTAGETFTNDMDPAKYFALDNVKADVDTFGPPPSTPTASRHRTADVSPTPQMKFKEKALAMLNDRPKGTPLGRAHTMPNLSPRKARSVSDSDASGKTRARPKPYSRGKDLQSVQENEE